MPPLHHSGCPHPLVPHHHGSSVTFVIGTLDGDPVKLNALKNYVSKALCNLLRSSAASSFNIIYFTSEVTKWCDRMVRCVPDTVAEATSWVQTLPCGPGDTPTGALSAAIEDPDCQTVHLVIDSLPGPELQDIYSWFGRRHDVCSVNVVYLVGEPSDNQAEGSFKMINLQPSGSSKGVSCDSQCSKPPSICGLSPLPCHKAGEPTLSCSSSFPIHSATGPVAHRPSRCPPEALGVLRGARVLARRETDGFYYLGHIAREAEGSKDHFLIEFEKCRSSKGKGQFRMQETPVCDIIHYEDARWRPLSSGDRVLAPLESNVQQYGPGTVLQGAETRERSLDFESSGVLVTFWNGKTKRIPPGLAIWIPQHVYDRISLELHIPLESRKKLVDSCFGFHRSSPCEVPEPPQPPGGSGSCLCLYCSPDHSVCQRCHVPEEQWAALRKSLNLISRLSTIKEKTAKEKDGRKNKKQEDRSEVIHPRERKGTNKKRGTTASRGNVQSPSASQEKYLMCYKEKQNKRHTGTQCSPTQSENEAAADYTTGPSHRVSPTSTGDMTQLQKTLHCIEKAMKEDRLAMEAAIRESRPRMASLILNHELKARKSEELKGQREATKVDLWSKQAVERERRRQEKVQEMEQKERMMQESRRLKSGQRVQLDLERRLDQEGLEAQQAEARRAAAEERYLKQKRAAEEELRKDRQRVQFWTERRKEREIQDAKQIQRNQEEDTKELQQNRMTERMRERDADVHSRHRHQQLQETSKRGVSKRLEQFYQQVERENQKDKELQEYLKERNLQALRSAALS